VYKDIEGYNGNYQINEFGEIYSKRRRGSGGIVLAQHCNSSGYKRVTLRKGQEKKDVFVHRLVAETFLPHDNDKTCVNHIDGNKLNNALENLEWCTYSENMKHAIENGLDHIPKLSGENHPNSKLKLSDVLKIKKSKNKNVKASIIAKEYNVTPEQIYNIWNGKQWLTAKEGAIDNDI